MKNNNTVETDDTLISNKSTNQLIKNWSSKINDFQVLVIYNEEGKYPNIDLSTILRKNNIKGSIIDIPIFKNNIESETFIIWQQSYRENKELFFKLRLNARNELTLRIAKVIVAYLLNKYEKYSATTINNHSRLKEKKYIDQLIQKFDNLLKQDTFLADYEVWDDFCKWFKKYLTDWVMEDMEETIGLGIIEKMDKNQINELFHKYITKSISGNSQFMFNFKNIVSSYVQKWITNIISTMGIENISLDKTVRLLNLKESTIAVSKEVSEKDITITLINQGNLVVMSNVAYQSVRESISNNSFESYHYTPWPTALLNKGSIKGIVQLKPLRIKMNNDTKDQIMVQQSWDQVDNLSELDVDVFDALCSLYLSKARHRKDIIEIQLNDLLAIRGLKPKLGGDGRRGGYERKQLNQILNALTKIQNLWIRLDEIIIYQKGKPVQMALQGRAFIFKDQDHNDYFIENEPLDKKLLYTVDEVFSKFLYGSSRQVALLPIQALRYNPYREVWEKKLTRYFSWRWRTQAKNGDYLQPHKLSTLLDAIGEKVNERTPSRTRERMEKAFDKLLEDGVIASWQYEKWDETIASNNGWVRVWLNSTVLIDPPEVIKEHYYSIKKNRKVEDKPYNKQESSGLQRNIKNFSAQIKALRKKLGLTLLQAAEEMEISASYLSNIERGMSMPSTKIKTRMESWMKNHI